ncbi:MAG TPA: phosphopantetheine-binding protein, partial [Thermoanaerobaculia bacterium]|nr:phosphopantetheine-binding protein [Thermoanaerobaculia bacterium]
LSPSGKVDRRALSALAAPERARDPGAELVAPRTPTEKALAEVWKELLGLEQVGASDSFFELGGYSLLAIQVIARVRQAFGVEISLREVFATPTIAGLAGLIDSRAAMPVDDDELAALLDELDLISDTEALGRLEILRAEDRKEGEEP